MAILVQLVTRLHGTETENDFQVLEFPCKQETINSFMGVRRWYLKASRQFTLKKGCKSDKYCQTLKFCQILENHPIKFKFSGYGFLNRYFDIFFWSNSEMVWWKPLVDLTWNDPVMFHGGELYKSHILIGWGPGPAYPGAMESACDFTILGAYGHKRHGARQKAGSA